MNNALLPVFSDSVDVSFCTEDCIYCDASWLVLGIDVFFMRGSEHVCEALTTDFGIYIAFVIPLAVFGLVIEHRVMCGYVVGKVSYCEAFEIYLSNLVPMQNIGLWMDYLFVLSLYCHNEMCSNL